MVSAESLNAQFESRDIPIVKIIPPSLAERQTMDEREMAELSDSIADVGLLEPIIVKPVGDMFEVVAGHRRLIACEMADYTPVPCRVIINGVVDPLSVLIAENENREEVNPIEQARFFQRVLIERCEGDTDALCIVVRRKREFVEDRLLLLMGHPEVVDALQHKQVSIAAARELNKITDLYRMRQLLQVTIQQGASARQVAEWRRQSDALGPIFQPGELEAAAAMETQPVVEPFVMRCWFCEDAEDPHTMELVYLHKMCKKAAGNILFNRQG